LEAVNELGDVRLAYSSICTICDNAVKITESAKSGTKVSAKRTCSRSSVMECIEKVLSTWIDDQDQCRMPVIMLLVPARLVLFRRICPKVIIILNHLVQVQVGLAGYVTLK
jgi:hypothetical protein